MDSGDLTEHPMKPHGEIPCKKAGCAAPRAPGNCPMHQMYQTARAEWRSLPARTKFIRPPAPANPLPDHPFSEQPEPRYCESFSTCATAGNRCLPDTIG